jgi:hypothetical protein
VFDVVGVGVVGVVNSVKVSIRAVREG